MRHVLAAPVLAAPVLALVLAWSLGGRVAAQTQPPLEQQQVVDRATLAAQEMLNPVNGKDARAVLRDARAVMVCPQVLRAGFLLGGQGGTCVLVARDGGGGWSFPAFYGLGGGSIGFQAGLEDAQVMLFIMNDRGLKAVLDSQFKLGADASATFVDMGGGVEGATTAALRADIVGFTRARGLFAGIALGGSLLSTKSDWNQAYYGRPMAAQQVVISMEANNPAADPLREVLIRASAPPAGAAPSLPPPTPLGADSLPPPGAAAPRASIQQQTLPPPRR